MEKANSLHIENHTVLSFMTDSKRRITPTYILCIMQDAAVNHANTMDIGWDYLHQFNQFWALSRIDLEIIRRPEWREKLILSTWPKKHNHLVQPRDHEITDINGEVLIRATSNWCILDAFGKPQILDNYEERLLVNPNRHAIESPASRLRTKIENEHPDYKPVVYSDVDMNQHANNTAYVTWVMNSFNRQFHLHHELTFLSVNFIQQTMGDDRYTIQKQEITKNDFLCSIYSERENIEVCRVRTVWKED